MKIYEFSTATKQAQIIETDNLFLPMLLAAVVSGHIGISAQHQLADWG